MRNLRIPTLLGIFVLMVGVGVGVLLIQQRTIYRLGASPSTEPQDVRISNVTRNSFTVSWVTEDDTIGFVRWGSNQQLGNVERGEDLVANSVHHITVDGLAPQRTYFFAIESDGEIYENSGQPWSLKTPGVSGLNEARIVSGTVLDPFGEPLNGAIVYVSGNGLSTVSARTSGNGAFIINLSGSYNNSLAAASQLGNNSLLDVYIQGGPLGVSQAQIRLGSANPIPTMSVGTTYDFVNSLPADIQSAPESRLDLPESLDSVEQGQTIFRSN